MSSALSPYPDAADLLPACNVLRLAPEIDERAWLARRMLGVTASEAPAVLGVSPYQSALDVYLEKTGQRVDTSRSFVQRVGLAMEPAVAQLYREETGNTVLPSPGLCQSKEHPFLLATPDRLALSGDASQGVIALQIKNPGIYTAREWDTEAADAPRHVKVQNMVEMWITGCATGHIAAVLPGPEWFLGTQTVSANFTAWALPKLEAFWQAVQKRQPPEPTHQDTETIAAMFPVTRTPYVALPPEADEIVDEIIRIRTYYKDQFEPLEEKEAGLKNSLKMLLGDCEAGETPMGRKVSWKVQTREARYVEATSWRVLRGPWSGRAKRAEKALDAYMAGHAIIS